MQSLFFINTIIMNYNNLDNINDRSVKDSLNHFIVSIQHRYSIVSKKRLNQKCKNSL